MRKKCGHLFASIRRIMRIKKDVLLNLIIIYQILKENPTRS